MGNVVRVLALYDGKHEPYLITEYESFSSTLHVIEKLREPHARHYKFKAVYLDDLETIEAENAWYAVNVGTAPHPFDFGRFHFVEAFSLLWNLGRERAY